MRDIRMVKGGEDLGFAPKPGQAIGIIGDGGQEDLDRDVAVQSTVVRAIGLAHPARPEGSDDLIRAEARTGLKGPSGVAGV